MWLKPRIRIISFCTVFEFNYVRFCFPHLFATLALNRCRSGESKDLGHKAVGQTPIILINFENANNYLLLYSIIIIINYYYIQELNFDFKNYFDLIDLQNYVDLIDLQNTDVTQPPVLEDMSEDEM